MRGYWSLGKIGLKQHVQYFSAVASNFLVILWNIVVANTGKQAIEGPVPKHSSVAEQAYLPVNAIAGSDLKLLPLDEPSPSSCCNGPF